MKQQRVWFAWIAAVIVLLSVGAVCVSALTTEPLIAGDLDRNGRITSYDIRLMLQHIVGTNRLDVIGMTQADVSGDGKVNTMDAHTVLTWIANDATQTAPTITTTTTTTTTTTIPTTTTTRPPVDDDGYYDDVVKP